MVLSRLHVRHQVYAAGLVGGTVVPVGSADHSAPVANGTGYVKAHSLVELGDDGVGADFLHHVRLHLGSCFQRRISTVAAMAVGR